jgi:hypothetical protein
MASKSNLMQYDKRVVERLIRAGLVRREDYKKYLAELPDVESQSEVIQASLTEDAGGERNAQGAQEG